MHTCNENSVSFWEKAFGFDVDTSRKDSADINGMERPGADEDPNPDVIRSITTPISPYEPGETVSGARFQRQSLSPEQDSISVASRQGVERHPHHVQHPLRGSNSAHKLSVSNVNPKCARLVAYKVMIFRRTVRPDLEIGSSAAHQRL